MVAIAVAIFRYGSLNHAKRAVVSVLDKTAWIDSHEKSDILNEAMYVARTSLLVPKKKLAEYFAMNCENVMKAWNRAFKRTWVRTHKRAVLTGMKMQRDRADPVVFYLVSEHQKPQPAHKDLQGKILVDRFWKSTLKDDYRLPLVEEKIKKDGIRTVQWSMGEPHYLIVRVNCKHVLIPLKTDDVLGMSEKDVRKKYKSSMPHEHRPISDKQRWKDFLQLRNLIRSEIERKIG